MFRLICYLQMPWISSDTFQDMKKALTGHLKWLLREGLCKAGSATQPQLLRQEIELKKLELEALKAQLENAAPQLKAFSEEERDNMADEEHGEEVEYHQGQAAKVCAAHYPLITNHYSLLDLECTRSQTSDGEGKCMAIG